MIRKIRVKKDVYQLTFDEEGILDTVVNQKGTTMHGGQAIVKRFVTHQHKLYAGVIPDKLDAVFVG